MREIKFRVWCPTSKHFSTQPWLSCDGLMLKWEHTGDIQTLTDIRFDNYVIQQYTGMKDKNGKDIYEGDIVKLFNGQIYKVEFIEESNEIQMSGYCFSSFGSEIIGNIFENSELLEK